MDFKPSRSWRWVLWAAVASTGCVRLPPVSPGQVTTAAAKWPGTDQAALETGQQLYKTRCSECHGILDGRGLVRNKWESVFDEMVDNAELKPEERESVYRYLWVLAQDPEGK